MDAFIQIQYKCSNNLGGICKSFITADSCLELKKEDAIQEDSCMQRQYREFSSEWCSNKERNHCLTFSTWPRICERTQSPSCHHQPNRTVAFSSKESTRRPTGIQKLELEQHVKYREQRCENMELLNNLKIFNATKTNDRITHYVADRQCCITLRFPWGNLLFTQATFKASIIYYIQRRR